MTEDRIKVFFDTEFTSLTREAELISIGLVTEDGRTFYAELTDVAGPVSEWIEENVIKNLLFNDSEPFFAIGHRSVTMKVARFEVAHNLRKWFGRFPDVELYADVLAYDWMLFCDLFRGAFNIPENIFYIPFDIATMLKCRGIDPDISREAFVAEEHMAKGVVEKAEVIAKGKHNALFDALIAKAVFEILR